MGLILKCKTKCNHVKYIYTCSNLRDQASDTFYNEKLPHAWTKCCPQWKHKCIKGKGKYQEALRREEGKAGVGDVLERYANLSKSQDMPESPKNIGFGRQSTRTIHHAAPGQSHKDHMFSFNIDS